jgi:pilus assembly protein FimV
LLKGGSVLKIIVKALSFIAALALSGAVSAVGMGGISVTTFLGEPLKAEIELVAVSKTDKSNISARLASQDVFKSAGLDYPGALPKLSFQIDTRANGESFIKMTSSQPVNEPFVSLLIELSWASGKLLREYTFLLDPPGFKAEQPKPVEVKPLGPVVVTAEKPKAAETKAAEPKINDKADESKATAEKTVASTKRETVPVSENSKPSSAEAIQGKVPENKNVVSGSIKVKQGESLSKIAKEIKASDVSLERMLVAMYRANENVFDGKNMNRLQTGKILRVPENEEFNKLAQADAVKEIHAQVADWHAYRLKLAAASNSASERAPKQETSGKISTKVADKTPAVKESAKEVVRLSKGEAPGDKTAAASKENALKDKLRSMEEEATAKGKALKDSNERIALLEKNIKDMQHLLDLKGQVAQPVKPVPVKPEEPAPVKTAIPEVKPEAKPEIAPKVIVPAPVQPSSAVKPAKLKPAKVEVPPPSLLDDILAEPLYLAGGAAALLGLGGFGFMRARRRNQDDTVDEVHQPGAPLPYISEPVMSSGPDDGDFTRIATSTHIIGPAQIDDVDPISEADLFLNFGRDKQAEEILKDALVNNPANQLIRLKLLSIYASRQDKKTFAELAGKIKDSGDVSAWAQAAEMGHRLDPANSLYEVDGKAVSPGVASFDESNVRQFAPSLDFDLGQTDTKEGSAPVAMDIPLEGAGTAPSGLDFDLGFDTPAQLDTVAREQASTQVLGAPAAVEKTDAASSLDFDLGFDLPAEKSDSAPAAEEYERTMVLNSPVNQTAKAAGDLQAVQANTVDFDITSGALDLTNLTPEKADEKILNLDELSFDITEALPATITKESVADKINPVEAAAMEFTLDFPIEAEATAEKESAIVVEPAAIDFSDINLNVGEESVAEPEEKVKDAHWHDVATKLDLARAYHEMGDASGAREILEEVLSEGDAQQLAAAKAMMQQLPA